MEAVFSDLVASRVFGVERIGPYVFRQRESVESGVEEGDVFGFRELFKGCADEGESRGIVSIEFIGWAGNQSYSLSLAQRDI